MSHFEVLRHLLYLLWIKEKKSFKRLSLCFYLILFIFNLTLFAAIPLFYKMLINYFATQSHLIDYLLIGLLYVGAFTIHKICQSLQEIILIYPTLKTAQSLYNKLFSHLLTLPLSFHLVNEASYTNQLLDKVYQSITQTTLLFFTYLIQNLFQIMLSVTILWYLYSPFYASTLGIVMGVFAFLSFRQSAKGSKLSVATAHKKKISFSHAYDTLFNYLTVHYFQNHLYEEEKAKELTYQTMNAVAEEELHSLKNILYHGSFVALGVVSVTLLCIKDYYAQQITVGDCVVINLILIQCMTPFYWLSTATSRIKEGLKNLKSIFSILTHKSTVTTDNEKKHIVISESPAILFDNVHFSYDSERPILKGLFLMVNPKQTIAIVGKSGTGKSTLTNLLYGFYDLPKGRIIIDGEDITEISKESLRKHIGIVPQETHLLNNTVEFNIRYGRLDASQDDIYEAAKIAGIHEWVLTLKDGYQTQVGERGVKLSGGEKQRISLARCFLKKPKILIFDEPTASLDYETEKAIKKNIKAISKNATTLIIAHRLSTITDADQIIYLQNGVACEQGTHEELLKLKGAYAHLWQQQNQKDISIIKQVG